MRTIQSPYFLYRVYAPRSAILISTTGPETNAKIGLFPSQEDLAKPPYVDTFESHAPRTDSEKWNCSQKCNRETPEHRVWAIKGDSRGSSIPWIVMDVRLSTILAGMDITTDTVANFSLVLLLSVASHGYADAHSSEAVLIIRRTRMPVPSSALPPI